DGRLDLFVVTAEEGAYSTRLFRGLEGGFFERTELPLAGQGSVPELGGFLRDAVGAGVIPGDAGGLGAPYTPAARGERGTGLVAGSPSGGSLAAVVNGAGGRVALAPTADCAASIHDEANPAARCLGASTTPMLGRLYPLSENLFVALGGNV